MAGKCRGPLSSSSSMGATLPAGVERPAPLKYRTSNCAVDARFSGSALAIARRLGSPDDDAEAQMCCTSSHLDQAPSSTMY